MNEIARVVHDKVHRCTYVYYGTFKFQTCQDQIETKLENQNQSSKANIFNDQNSFVKVSCKNSDPMQNIAMRHFLHIKLMTYKIRNLYRDMKFYLMCHLIPTVQFIKVEIFLFF